MKHIIVANPGSYYFEGYWTGWEKKFSYNKDLAEKFETYEEAKQDLKKIERKVLAPSSCAIIISV